ncbi:hypothetical protein KDK_48480 [Dictyobacter kobayashii]|uniref:Uncharacterized protein n=1 Tax=Dictyobacter kobayashii TaxID=2014872 RepID=A0A402APD7_9CHLR|nr:hypothetical protein KDK_48480 [Dictyobacter kobayashii]
MYLFMQVFSTFRTAQQAHKATPGRAMKQLPVHGNVDVQPTFSKQPDNGGRGLIAYKQAQAA